MTTVFNIAKLRELAIQHGDTKADGSLYGLRIATRTGVDPGYLSRILSGKSGAGTVTLSKLAKAYGVPIDDLVTHEAAA